MGAAVRGGLMSGAICARCGNDDVLVPCVRGPVPALLRPWSVAVWVCASSCFRARAYVRTGVLRALCDVRAMCVRAFDVRAV